MAGITVVVSTDPEHPFHEHVRAAISAHSLRLSDCVDNHLRCADGRVSVQVVAPRHIGAVIDESSGIFRYDPPAQPAAEGPGTGWLSTRFDGVTIACDHETGGVRVLTDRFNRYPVFFYGGNGIAVATTEIAPLLRCGVIPFAWDLHGVASTLCWGFPLFPGTLYHGVTQSSAASEYVLCPEGGASLLHTEDEPVLSGYTLDDVLDLYMDALVQALESSDHAAVALSGGWDTRTTLAVLLGLGKRPTLMTFGVPGSTDVRIGERLARDTGSRHHVLLFDKEFADQVHRHLSLLARSGNGLATPMAAHEVYVNMTLARDFDAVIDSAGCEFRRGHRIQRRLTAASDTRAAADLFLETHATGAWAGMRPSGLLTRHAQEAREHILATAETASSNDEAVDTLFRTYVWDGHYTHSYNSQANAIRCRMPMYDPRVHAAFLSLPSNVRWSKAFQLHAIRRFRPELLHVPVSHGGMQVPARDDFASKLPALIRNRASSFVRPFSRSLAAHIDSYRGHLRYPEWISAVPPASLHANGFVRNHADWFLQPSDGIPVDPLARLFVEYLALIEAAASV